MNKLQFLNIKMNLTKWPAAVACSVCFISFDICATIVISQLIKHNYKLTNTTGVSIAPDNSGSPANSEESCAGDSFLTQVA